MQVIIFTEKTRAVSNKIPTGRGADFVEKKIIIVTVRLLATRE